MENGTRKGSFKEFAEKFADDNLTDLVYSHVRKIIIEDKRAIGVELTRFGKIERYKVRQEMILSAGAVGSPQTLMLSGVGDEVHLTEVGVQPVGENLSYDILSAIYPSTWLAYLSGGGPLTSSGACGGLAYVHTGVNNDSRPDIQYHMLEVSPATDHGLAK